MDYGAYNHGAVGYLCNANFSGCFIFCRQEILDLNFNGSFYWTIVSFKFVEEKKTSYVFFSLCRFPNKVVMF